MRIHEENKNIYSSCNVIISIIIRAVFCQASIAPIPVLVAIYGCELCLGQGCRHKTTAYYFDVSGSLCYIATAKGVGFAVFSRQISTDGKMNLYT